jgi:3-hydroxyisobutyrate dehydrogenase-like beta-hydroxyacid dehydrogenase
MARIGFIGTGLMGAPMVRRLLANGHRVTVWNRSSQKTLPLLEDGASTAESPRALAESNELLALCLTDGPAVAQVIFGREGVAEAQEAPTIIDFTSMMPAQNADVADRLRSAGNRHYVDAPVSGGVAGAIAGSLTIMCGGAADDIVRLKPILDAVALRVTHLGKVGSGQVAKLCNQHICAASVIAMAEGIAFARHYGMDVSQLPAALAGGFADSKAWQLWGGRMATGEWEPNVGPVDTMLKDVRNVAAAMQESGLRSPLASAVQRIYQSISEGGRGGDDLGSIESFFSSPR